MLYYFFVVSPNLAKEDFLRRAIRNKEADQKEMEALQGAWERMKREHAAGEAALQVRGDKFTLLSFLEGISREVGIANKIQYVKPLTFPEEPGSLKKEGMEVKLEDMDIHELVEYLYKIEYSGKLLKIQRIKVQRVSGKDDTSSLRVTIQVHTFSRKT
jgi:hypothetical protein